MCDYGREQNDTENMRFPNFATRFFGFEIGLMRMGSAGSEIENN